ncbi:CDGSH iron-sulfur domain-containing protein [Kitasatospora purpeofusca]|uniref:CDGSH iron-sulfur domain-containing protein n=1 Tax=Kitasatospora purpeofusca TaxID=67352 RepID=UPI00365EFC82
MIGPDGTARLCERPVVALCACRRSRCRPFCDTSHRRHGARRERDRDGEPTAPDGPTASGGSSESAESAESTGSAGSVGQG